MILKFARLIISFYLASKMDDLKVLSLLSLLLLSNVPSFFLGFGPGFIAVIISVNYDYVENRVVSLSAHVTKSLNEIRTDYESAEVFEITHDESRSDISGEIIIETVDSIWNGDYAVDNAVERQLISSFFRRIVDAIANVADERRGSNSFLCLD